MTFSTFVIGRFAMVGLQPLKPEARRIVTMLVKSEGAALLPPL